MRADSDGAAAGASAGAATGQPAQRRGAAGHPFPGHGPGFCHLLPGPGVGPGRRPGSLHPRPARPLAAALHGAAMLSGAPCSARPTALPIVCPVIPRTQLCACLDACTGPARLACGLTDTICLCLACSCHCLLDRPTACQTMHPQYFLFSLSGAESRFGPAVAQASSVDQSSALCRTPPQMCGRARLRWWATWHGLAGTRCGRRCLLCWSWPGRSWTPPTSPRPTCPPATMPAGRSVSPHLRLSCTRQQLQIYSHAWSAWPRAARCCREWPAAVHM